MTILRISRKSASGPGIAYSMRRSNLIAFYRALPPAFMLLNIASQLEQQQGLTPANAVKARQLKAIGVMLLLTGIDEIVRPDIIVYPPRVMKFMTIAGLTHEECITYTRFRNDQLLLIYRRLQFPQGTINVQGPNFKLNFDSQWLFILVLYRLSHGTDYGLMVAVFGKDATQLCRAFNWGIDWLYREWVFHKMHNNVGEISDRIPMFAEKIKTKVEHLGREVNAAAQQQQNEGEVLPAFTLAPLQMHEYPCVFGFLDGTQREVRRPGAGPAEAGPNAVRVPFWWLLQHAFFSGKQGYCSEKFITFNGPDGHIYYCSTAYSGRNHDADVVRRVGLHAMLVAAQQNNNGAMRCLYGDSAFAREECIQKRFGFPLTDNRKLLNLCLNKARTSVEHSYGIVLNLFKLNMVWWKKWASNPIHKIVWPVSCFFANLLNCFHHNQISAYFQTAPMSIEQYLPA